MIKLIYYLLAMVLIAGCGEIERIIKKESPHDKYLSMLINSGLAETNLGKSWIKASENALTDSLAVKLPYKEEGYFFEDETKAFSYRFDARRGEIIFIEIQIDTLADFKLFADLFKADEMERISFADDSLIIRYETEENEEFLLRIQPELLKGGSFILTIKQEPSIAFPVIEKDSRAIKSIYGDDRDAGRRKHKGVDIFAAKGTPVVAAVDGIISRTGTNNLGGKVVWLFGEGKSFYYAHLDSQIVTSGDFVLTGDTLGLVGNTGNARTTPPHLHFGIYMQGEGAVDPLPFIKNIFDEPVKVNVDKRLVGKFARIKKNKTGFVYSSGKKLYKNLQKNIPVKIYGGIGNMYKASLPDGRIGFITASDIISADDSYSNKKIATNNMIFSSPTVEGNFITSLNENEIFPVYGEFNDYLLVKYQHRFVWLK